MMLNWYPWLSVAGLARSGWARLVLTALVLVQLAGPNLVQWGQYPAPASPTGTAHGFLVASGAGEQPVICFFQSSKPPAVRETLLHGLKLGGRPAAPPALLVRDLPGECAGNPALFEVRAEFPGFTVPKPVAAVASPGRRHYGRAPPVGV